MDPERIHLIRQKLANLTAYVDEMAPYLDVSYQKHLVHDYDQLDNRTLFYSARQLLDDARAYMVQVHGYLGESREAR